MSQKGRLGHMTELTVQPLIRAESSTDPHTGTRGLVHDRTRGVPAGRASSRRHLLNDLQQAIIEVANAIGGNPGTPLSETMRVFAAIEHMST